MSCTNAQNSVIDQSQMAEPPSDELSEQIPRKKPVPLRQVLTYLFLVIMTAFIVMLWNRLPREPWKD